MLREARLDTAFGSEPENIAAASEPMTSPPTVIASTISISVNPASPARRLQRPALHDLDLGEPAPVGGPHDQVIVCTVASPPGPHVPNRLPTQCRDDRLVTTPVKFAPRQRRRPYGFPGQGSDQGAARPGPPAAPDLRAWCERLATHVAGHDRRPEAPDERDDRGPEDEHRDDSLDEGEAGFVGVVVSPSTRRHFTLTWLKMPYIAETSAMATKPTMRPMTTMIGGLEQRRELLSL